MRKSFDLYACFTGVLHRAQEHFTYRMPAIGVVADNWACPAGYRKGGGGATSMRRLLSGAPMQCARSGN